ncbi:hypothetical protein PG994_002148 [Apiospora phragmitis]|uniref:Uncharacterized protein n=1 Tax=Apiospora phragmitis TaxID=2905665 RepID=A0ABR1WVH2_9PEZI
MSEQENYLYQKRSTKGAVTHHHDNDKKSSTGKIPSWSTAAPLNTSFHRNPNFVAGPGRSTTLVDNSTHGTGFITSPGLRFSYLAGTGQPGFDKIGTEWTT